MVARIKQLSPLVANQIAAGEVVERPVSVVKELLENALDAGATHIQVKLSFGGLNRIAVSDNGEGIERADMALAVSPHATSKIRDLEDLLQINTMGFRGEALASIASVSKLTLQSCKRDGHDAYQLIFDEAHNINILPCARSGGTTVIVDDLFFNVPVRKKFLKSERTEFLAVDKLVRCFALAAPQVGIQFYHNEYLVLSVPACLSEEAKSQRVRKILGKNFVESAIQLDSSTNDLRLYGWLGHPDVSRSQQDRMWIYVNGRMVQDRLLNHAIKQAYDEQLHPGRYPTCLLYFSVPPEEVDVNVHPTKHELRFHDARLVHDFIRSSIQKTLRPEFIVNNKRQVERKEAAPSAFFLKNHEPVPLWILNKDFVLFKKESDHFLLNIKKLGQDLLKKKLEGAHLPLQARQLFLPIRISLPSYDEKKLEFYFDVFAEIGIQLSWVGSQELCVRSVPIELPQLQLENFLKDVLQKDIKETSTLLQHAIQHSPTNAIVASEVEQSQWFDFLEHCDEQDLKVYLSLVTSKHCELLFSLNL